VPSHFLISHTKMAATVPHIAIAAPTTIRAPSRMLQLPSIITFAKMGPIIESKKAENDPRKAINELNSGIKTETATARVVKHIRCRIPSARFHPKREPAGATDNPSGLSARSSGEEIGVSMPSKISIVALS